MNNISDKLVDKMVEMVREGDRILQETVDKIQNKAKEVKSFAEADRGSLAKVAKALYDMRSEYPELRYGQIIYNAVIQQHQKDLFYVTDDELVKMLEEHTKFLDGTCDKGDQK
jgi:hypothetical protein